MFIIVSTLNSTELVLDQRHKKGFLGLELLIKVTYITFHRNDTYP